MNMPKSNIGPIDPYSQYPKAPAKVYPSGMDDAVKLEAMTQGIPLKDTNYTNAVSAEMDVKMQIAKDAMHRDDVQNDRAPGTKVIDVDGVLMLKRNEANRKSGKAELLSDADLRQLRMEVIAGDMVRDEGVSYDEALEAAAEILSEDEAALRTLTNGQATGGVCSHPRCELPVVHIERKLTNAPTPAFRSGKAAKQVQESPILRLCNDHLAWRPESWSK